MMPVDLRTEHEHEPFWRGRHFTNEAKEERFTQKFGLMAVRATQMWAVTRIIADIISCGGGLQSGVGIGFYLAFTPIFLVTVIALVWVSCASPKHAKLIGSVAAVLASAGCGILAHAHAVEWMENVRSNDLHLVFKEIEGNRAAMHQLEQYLGHNLASAMLDSQLLQVCLQLLLLVSLGFSQCTLLGSLFIPLSFCSIGMTIPYGLPRHFIVMWGRLVTGALFSLLLAAKNTASQRREFLLVECFENALQSALDASSKADSVLNHTLKNTMADAAGLIELFLKEAECSDDDAQQLLQCAASLRRGMRSCQHRQAYLSMASESYALRLQPVCLAELVKELAVGRSMQVDVEDCNVFLDQTLCQLILDNAISNAFQHGAGPDPGVKLRVTSVAIEGGLRLTLVISNRANPNRPTVTPQFLRRVLDGEVGQGRRLSSAMSDQIGLQHAFLAAKLHGMHLSLVQHGTQVEFIAKIDVQFAEKVEVIEDPFRAADLAAFPNNLKAFIIDDSAMTRRLLHHSLTSMSGCSVEVFGRDETEVEDFIAAAVAHGDIAVLDQHLEYGGDANVLGTDIIRQLLEREFKGLICVYSGNVAAADIAMYRAAGAHCVFGKDDSMKQIIEDIQIAYVRCVMSHRPPVPGNTQSHSRISLQSLSDVDVPVECSTGGGGISPGENFAGKISPLRKVAKFSPGEILA